jgi:predicted DNA-binding transcriptional regulator AlpA
MEIGGRSGVTAKIVMRELDISQPTLYRWVKSGLLPRPIKLGRNRYYIWDEVQSRLAVGE